MAKWNSRNEKKKTFLRFHLWKMIDLLNQISKLLSLRVKVDDRVQWTSGFAANLHFSTGPLEIALFNGNIWILAFGVLFVHQIDVRNAAQWWHDLGLALGCLFDHTNKRINFHFSAMSVLTTSSTHRIRRIFKGAASCDERHSDFTLLDLDIIRWRNIAPYWPLYFGVREGQCMLAFDACDGQVNGAQGKEQELHFACTVRPGIRYVSNSDSGKQLKPVRRCETS